jgi:energy-coupling factor transport system permease protein
MISGIGGLCVGAFGLLDGSAPLLLGAPTLLAAAVLCCAGLAVGGRRVRRTRYRPDPWRMPEWAVALSGALCAALLELSANLGGVGLDPSFSELRFPPLPVLPTIAILIAALPALAAPPPLRNPRRRSAPAAAEPGPRTELVT